MTGSNETLRNRRGLLLVTAGILMVILGWNLRTEIEAEPADRAEGILAVIGSEKFTAAAVDEAVASDLAQIEQERQQFEFQMTKRIHEARQQALESLVEQRLLEIEAKARGVTPEELQQTELAVPEPTDADVDAFYQERTAQGQRLPPKEQIAEQVKAFLRQQGSQGARDTFIASLKEKYDAEVYLEPFRTEVASEGFPSKGPADAPVTIVEFSDFECPYCSRVTPTLDQVEKAYGDKIRIVFRQFPLNNIHPSAQKAAEASLCAEEQSKFWEMHDLMFAEQRALKVADLKDKAGRAGLDVDEFSTCLESGRYADEVAADLAAGMSVGVTGTPAMFINGRFLGGAASFEQMKEIIDEELAG